jgi:hypothetical protein
MVIHAIAPNRKYFTSPLTFACSHFPTTPAAPTALEIEPEISFAAAYTRLGPPKQLLIAYLGHDPFTGPMLGSPKRNETSCVAFFSPDTPITDPNKVSARCCLFATAPGQMLPELAVSMKGLMKHAKSFVPAETISLAKNKTPSG